MKWDCNYSNILSHLPWWNVTDLKYCKLLKSDPVWVFSPQLNRLDGNWFRWFRDKFRGFFALNFAGGTRLRTQTPAWVSTCTELHQRSPSPWSRHISHGTAAKEETSSHLLKTSPVPHRQKSSSYSCCRDPSNNSHLYSQPPDKKIIKENWWLFFITLTFLRWKQGQEHETIGKIGSTEA